MSCPEAQDSPVGRRGIGVIQPQSGLDYPFVSPSEDVRYLIADFYLAFDDPGEYSATTPKVAFPLRIAHVYGAACVSDTETRLDVVIKDAANTTVLDTRNVGGTGYESANWGTGGTLDYRIYTWKTTAAVCRLVAYASWPPSDPDIREYDDDFAPESAVLDARTVYKMPKRVKAISVKQKSGPTVYGPYAGNIVFANNYNTELATASTAVGFRNNTLITLNAASGSGAGYYPECGGDTNGPAIQTINGVGPNEYGDFLIPASDCLYTRRATSRVGGVLGPATNPNTGNSSDVLRIGADCAPCCKCDDFVNTALYMNYVKTRYQLIADRVLNDVKAIHQQNIALWTDQRSCTINHPLKLLMVPQRCPYIDFVLMLCNPCQACLPGSTLRLDLTTVPFNESVTAELVDSYTAMFAPDIDGRAVPVTTSLTAPEDMWLSVKFPALKLGTSAYVKIRLKFSLRAPYAVSGQLTGVLDAPYSTPIKTGCDNETPESERETASAVATQSLYCGDTETIGFTC